MVFTHLISKLLPMFFSQQTEYVFSDHVNYAYPLYKCVSFTKAIFFLALQ